jgi:DNA-binding response OmpR family regulator
MKLLLIEDEDGIGRLICQGLCEANHLFTHVDTGLEVAASQLLVNVATGC